MSSGADTPPAFSRIHTSWLVTLFLCGLAYIVVIPPFKSIDEVAHWDRLWTVATGQLNCRWIPNAASDFVYLVNEPKVSSILVLSRGSHFTGSDGHLPIATASCTYPPVGYLAPALFARFLGLSLAGKPVEGGMFWSFYIARVVNWLLFFGALWFTAWRVPWARNFLLVFASVPEVLQQATALNQDSILCACTLLVIYAWQAPPRWRSMALVVAMSVIATSIKPIYAGFALVVLLILPRIPDRIRRWQRWAVPIGGVLLSVGAWWIWIKMHNVDPTAHSTHVPVVGVQPSEQRQYLLSSPWILPRLMLAQIRQLFGHDTIRGSLSSFLGAFGWCQYEVYLWVYPLLLAAIALAVGADLTSRDEPPRYSRSPWWAWGLVLAALLAQLPAVVAVMYEFFSPFKSESVVGVQGRYFLSLLLVLGCLGLYGLKLRLRIGGRASQAMSIAAAGACLVGNVGALLWVFFFYWQ